jgi:myo-inositol 2-dehydrogenase / D-chiro-inositol 1-dehydrogenase
MIGPEEKMGRRQFLGAAGTAGILIIKPQLVRGTAANSAVRLGLLGCGHRGTYVATSFANNTSARVVALADLFQDQLDKGKQHFDGVAAKLGYAGIDSKLMFRGPHAYQALANCPDVDMVQISTPDIFHPGHLEAVVDAGKHVYCEKPAAVDVTGCKRVLKIGEKVQNRFSLDIGFQCRHAPPYAELVRRVHAGALGKLACGAAYYHSGGINYPPYPDVSPLERRIRTFFWDRVMSGDILVDQSIHLVDLCNWMLETHPLKAIGTGGRRVKEDSGDCWDHFDVTFTYPNDVHLNLNSFQAGKALGDVSVRLFGSQGVAELHYKGVVGIYGDQPWEWEGSIGPASPRPGHANIYAIEHESLADKAAGIFHDALDRADPEKEIAVIDSITSGKFHNQAALGAETTLSTILGRQAAYNGKETTWDDLLESNQSYDPELEGIDLREFE